MIIWSVLGVLIIIDLFLCSIYTRFRIIYETRKKKQQENISTAGKKETSRFSIKIVFRYFDNWLYGLTRYTSIWIGKIPSYFIRKCLYIFVFKMKIKWSTVIMGGCELRSPWNITIGDSVIGAGAILDGRNGIVIEDDVVLATGVWIWTEQHSVDDPYFRCLNSGGPVYIKKHCWIGNRVVILPKTVLEEGCVAAAGAVVTKSCEPFFMYGGVPAKKIRKRNSELLYTKVTKYYWPFY